MIVVTCSCGRKISVPDHVAGKSGKCKGCGIRLVIPQTEEYIAFSEQDLQDDVSVSPVGQASLVTLLEEPAALMSAFPSDLIETTNHQAASGKHASLKTNWSTRRLLMAAMTLILILSGALMAAFSLFGPNYYALAPEALRSGDTDLAEKYYRLGLQQAIREDRHFFIAVTHQGLASVEFERKNWAEAEREAKTAIDEFLCPRNENRDSCDYSLLGCFQTMGYSQIFQGKFEEGVRKIEEADRISSKTTSGFNEPAASLEMAKMYRLVASLSHQTHFYWRAIERIKKAEDGLLFSKFGSLEGSIAHANVLRVKARIARESGLLDDNPDVIEAQANRIEAEFHARNKADRARHELPSQ